MVLKCYIFRYEHVDFGEEGFLGDLEPVVAKVHVEKSDGLAYFAIRTGANAETDALVERASRALGVNGE